jgi:hypothetical protein
VVWRGKKSKKESKVKELRKEDIIKRDRSFKRIKWELSCGCRFEI